VYRSRKFITSSHRPAFLKTARATAFPLLVMTAALLLSACAQSGKPAPLNVATKQPKTPAHDVMAPEAAAPAAPATPPATIWQTADKLMGLAADQLQAALGAPARIRDEESSRIYQYIGSDCVLDLFLYQEAEGSYRVSYAEARSIRADKKPVDACLKSLPAPIVANNAPST
jgi:hypothetical protein